MSDGFQKKVKVSRLAPHRISKYRNCTAVAVAVFLYLEILGGGGASPDTLTFSEKTITYRLTLRTFRGGPVGILYFFFELVIFRGGPVKKITLYNLTNSDQSKCNRRNYVLKIY